MLSDMTGLFLYASSVDSQPLVDSVNLNQMSVK